MIFDIFATGSERQIVRFNILLYGAEVHSSTAPLLHIFPGFPLIKSQRLPRSMYWHCTIFYRTGLSGSSGNK